jgi:hypothetical protein
MNTVALGALRALRGRSVRVLIHAAVGIGLATAALAHHSQSEFDFKLKVEVEGTVTRVDWRSPHARLYVDAVGEDGMTVNWDFELPSPTTMMRRGWKRDSLKPGDHVTVTGSRARNYPNIAYATTIKDASGKAMFTGITRIYEPEKEPTQQPQE